MNKWYIIEETIPSTKLLLLEECNGVVYERFVVGSNGKSWKPTKETIFYAGVNLERFKKFCDKTNYKIREINEMEVFAIML